ncbi:aminopeptidase [Limnobacter humi]|uniref:Aminopeptidase n=1 Tax=Limnobacter humi TaxID=1778671 RepID=A0ABT1WHT8_9BURK|nr:aminopeptidase [Limnobacter humi]MCQ8897087.1 aminopeptidase [Limnobacter humi]
MECGVSGVWGMINGVGCWYKAWFKAAIKGVGHVCFGLLCVALLGGCSSTRYLWQAASGHLSVLAASRDVDDVLNDPETPGLIRQQLAYARDIRQYSVEVLGLPDNQSYRRYADVGRPYVVWNVVIAPADSLDLKKSCFPITGCISYRGFYDETDAKAYAEPFRAEGMDVAVIGVPAYSTLGYTPDPLLNTFIRFPAGELARMVFHELAHQVLYVADDTVFNESFASAVEELGVNAWLSDSTRVGLKAQYDRFDVKRMAFRDLMAKARADLKMLYDDDSLTPEDKQRRKAIRFATLRRDYDQLKANWDGWPGFDPYMSVDLNNAKLAVSGLYDDDVPGFKRLFAVCGDNFGRFYSAARWLADQSPDVRRQWGTGNPSLITACPS